MDTPKVGDSWLESFLPDIWACFAWYLPGEQLGRLMMTGATLLRHRLKSPQVVKSIKLGEDNMVFNSLAMFLSDYPSVEELHIHSPAVNWSNKLNLTLDSIPSGVRKLVLSGDWKEAVDTLFGDNGATLKLNEYLPHLESLDFDSLTFTNYSWMTHSPQSLTELHIRQWDGSVELPTSLINFKADFATLSTSSFVSKLPPSLETFDISDLTGVELIVPLLPASVRKLSLGAIFKYSNGPRSPQNILEQLPKSLTWFEFPSSSPEINLEAKPEAALLLPTTLAELHIGQPLPCSSWSFLPPLLTKLSSYAPQDLSVLSKIIDDHGVHRQVKSIPFDRLPKSLTRLELISGYSFCGPPITSSLPYFPPHLTYLKMSYLQITPETAKLLPSSLTYLEIGNICERVCEHLPNSLKTLISTAALMTPNLIKFLPKSLKCLDISIPSSGAGWFDHNTGEAIESISKLPEYPIHEKCTANDFDWKDHSSLPSTLTILNIQDAEELGDTFLQHQHLPNLLELSLCHSKHFSDNSIPLLSRHLTELNLRISSNVSGKSFEFLPRGLTSLNLESSESIFDSDIQHLPRTLKSAIFPHAIHLTDLCIPDLPPHLEWLDMKLNTQISPSSFPKLPYTIRTYQTHRMRAQFATWRVLRGEARVVQMAKKKNPRQTKQVYSKA